MDDETLRTILVRAARFVTEYPVGWSSYPDQRYTLVEADLAQWTSPFELRKLVVRFSRGPSGGTQEDADQTTFHFLNLTGGLPDSTWTGTDYGQVESAFDTFWTAMKPHHPAFMSLNEYRWFKSGPAWDLESDSPYNPPERTTARSVAGTSTSEMLPPQVASSVTEIIPIRKRWGRFYWPSPTVTTTGSVKALSLEGRWSTTGGNFAPVLATAAVAFYNSCRTNELIPVVWSKHRSAYTSPAGHAIAEHAATAYEVTDLQVDNLPDVIRSRRYDGPTVRLRTVLT